MFFGMQIAFNELFEKQSSPIRLNLTSASNVTATTFACEKHDFPRTRTDRGMQISFNEQSAKDDSLILLSFESASMANSLILARQKHDFPSTSTARGM
jgi:hypothetical protein